MENNINPKAICGHCGKEYKDHYFEDRIYCFEDTNGDTWNDDPEDDLVASWLEFKFPEWYEEVVKSWKLENGHKVA